MAGGEGDDKMRRLDGIIDSINGHEFEQTLGDSEVQGSLECCSPWSCKELDMTGQQIGCQPYKSNHHTLSSHVNAY